MKLKTLGLVALAATIGLASCNKEEGPAADKQIKSVTLNLANVKAPTRADGAMIEDETQVTLNNLQVFFSDGINLHRAQKVDHTEQPHYFDLSKTPLNDVNATIFHYLPAGVKEVYVLGNLNAEQSWTTVAQITKALSTEEATSLENDADKLFLYDKKSLSRANEDIAGHALYKATLSLVPAVARIEFEAFGMTNTGSDLATITSVDLTKMALVNYSDAATYNSDNTLTIADQKTATIDDARVWDYMDKNKTIFTANLTGIELTTSETVKEDIKDVKTWKNTEGVDCLYYHVYPGKAPAIVVTMLADFEGAQTPQYVYSKGFKAVDDLEAGKIYRIKYIFDESNIGEVEKCVQVTVEIAKWDVVTVTPEF